MLHISQARTTQRRKRFPDRQKDWQLGRIDTHIVEISTRSFRVLRIYLITAWHSPVKSANEMVPVASEMSRRD